MYQMTPVRPRSQTFMRRLMPGNPLLKTRPLNYLPVTSMTSDLSLARCTVPTTSPQDSMIKTITEMQNTLSSFLGMTLSSWIHDRTGFFGTANDGTVIQTRSSRHEHSQ